MNISILTSANYDNCDKIYDIILSHINVVCDTIIYNEKSSDLVYDIAEFIGIDIIYQNTKPDRSLIIYEDNTYEIYDFNSGKPGHRQLPIAIGSNSTVAV